MTFLRRLLSLELNTPAAQHNAELATGSLRTALTLAFHGRDDAPVCIAAVLSSRAWTALMEPLPLRLTKAQVNHARSERFDAVCEVLRGMPGGDIGNPLPAFLGAVVMLGKNR